MLIVGLGNFGKEYISTFHNVGFMVIDALSSKLNVKLSKKNCEAKYYEGCLSGNKIILAQPLTYMNLSGNAVLKLSNKYKMANEQTIIIYDDLDLPAGKTRFRKRGSGGTHNGMRDVVEKVGENVCRIRIGIGKNEKIPVRDFVLSKMKGEEKELISEAIKKVTQCLIEFIDCGCDFKILEQLNN